MTTIQSTEEQLRQCSFEKPFTTIVAELSVYSKDLKVTRDTNNKLLVTVGEGTLAKRIVFDCSNVPCFNASIPEMLTAYIMAQLLKIAEANLRKGEEGSKSITDVMDQVQANFESKVLILNQINDEYNFDRS